MERNFLNLAILPLLNKGIMNHTTFNIFRTEYGLMGRRGLITGLFMLVVIMTSAQLVVNNSPPYDDTQYLIEEVFFGSGVTISNIQYFGSAGAIGFFDGTASNLGLDSGLILCTGDINVLPGPNDTTEATLTALGCPCPGDPEALLDALSGFSTNDAAIFQFDFIPVYNTDTTMLSETFPIRDNSMSA